MAAAGYRKGWLALGGHSHAWLQPDGGWGLSNAGLVVGEGASLLVDTLFDLPLTRDMLAAAAPLTVDAPITTVVNTHGNGDHWFGNQLLAGAEIIAAAGSVIDMHEVGPAQLRELLAAEGPTGRYARQIFGGYDFDSIVATFPTRTFEQHLTLEVGGIEVRLLDVGPAHTRADTIVHLPHQGIVFTGDIIFARGTPIVWAGPLSNWLSACDLLLGLDVHTVVPGHGPITGTDVVRDTRDYLEFVLEQATARHDAGMDVRKAALDIDLDRFAHLGESERLAANVAAVYRELDPGGPPVPGPHLFGCMAQLEHSRRLS